jgi:hypothetical protein
LKNLKVVGVGILSFALLAIAVLVGLAILFPTDNGPLAKTKMRLQSLATLLVTYKNKTGQFPNAAQGLSAAVDGANIGVTARHSLVTDGWGAPFIYKTGLPPLVYSMGENALDNSGDGDDIAAYIQTD